ncbi:hypothetical protein Esti_002187 [Eimeria stiedai]
MFQWQVRRFLDASLVSLLSPFVESFDRNHVSTSPGSNGPASSLSRHDSLRTGLREAAFDELSGSTGGRPGRSSAGIVSAEQRGSADNVETDDAYLAGRGEVLYTNLRLKRTILSDLGIPFTVAHGTVGSLTVSIPPLFSQLPIMVSIDSVLVLLVPQPQEDWCAPSAKTAYLRKRRRSLNDLTALLLLEKERNSSASEALGSSNLADAGKYEKAKSGPGGMQAYIRNNVQQMLLSKLKIQVSNIHIRYEHHPKAVLIPTAAPFSWGFVAPYLLFDHASVTAAAAAAAKAAIATSQPDTQPGDLSATLTPSRLQHPVRVPSGQVGFKTRREVNDTNPSDLQKGLLISIAVYWQSNERKFFHEKGNTEAPATTAAAEAAAAAAVFAGHGGDPSLTGTRAGLLLRPAPSAPSPLRTKFNIDSARGTSCQVEHVSPNDRRDRHRHSINSAQGSWLLPLLVFEAKLAFSKLALAQEHPPETSAKELLHIFECRLGVVLFNVDREMLTDALSIVRHAKTWRAFKRLTIDMPAAVKPLRQLFFQNDTAPLSSDDINVDRWPVSISASLLNIPKKWAKAAVALRRWYYAVRCISWMKRLSSHSKHFSPFEAPQLLLLRWHATYINTCCRLFYTRNSANVKGIQDHLKALEDGPLANLSLELLQLWRRQAAMDLTLPAGDLALLHQHLCLPSHSRCTANDSMGDAFAARTPSTPSNCPDSAFPNFATLGSLQIPTFVSSIPDALRSVLQKPDIRIPEGACFEGLPTPSELMKGPQHKIAEPLLPRRQPGGHTGKEASEGEWAHPHRMISQDSSGSHPCQSGQNPRGDGVSTHPQAGRCEGSHPSRWSADRLPDEWSVKGDSGTQNMKCSISFVALGIRLTHRPPQNTPARRRERWFLTRCSKIQSGPTNNREELREETTEWRYCRERVRFSGSLPQHRTRTTSFRLEQGNISHCGGDPQRLSPNFASRVPGSSLNRPRIPGIASGSHSMLLVNSRCPRKAATLPLLEEGVDALFFGLDFQSVVTFGRGMPYNGAVFSIQAGNASVSSCLKRFSNNPLPQLAVAARCRKLQRPMRGRQQTAFRTFNRLMSGNTNWSGSPSNCVDDPTNSESNVYTQEGALSDGEGSRFSAEEISWSDASEGPSRGRANHRLWESQEDSFISKQRRTLDTESGKVTNRAERSCHRKLQRTGENSSSSSGAFMECSFSPLSFSLRLFSPVVMPSPSLIHMLVCLWRDLRLNVQAELHFRDLTHFRPEGWPLYSSETRFEPRIWCSLTLSPTVFPSPSLHICKAAAAGALLAEKASVGPSELSAQRKMRAQFHGALDTSGARSTDSQSGISSKNDHSDGPANIIRIKAAAVLSMLWSYASRSIEIGAAHVRGGVLRHTGEFRGICPCVPVAYRQTLGHKLALMRELHWLKRPPEGYKLCLKVSKLAIVIPAASACSPKKHAVELKHLGPFKMWSPPLDGLSGMPSRAATSSELVENAATRLLESCRRCSLCRKENCCCRADPLSLLFQPPDLASPCVWLSCGELQASNWPQSAAEPEKADVRLLDLHAVVAPRLRNCLPLLQISYIPRTREPFGGEWASRRRTSDDLNFTGDVGADDSRSTKVKLAEDTYPGTNWQTRSEHTAQGYVREPLRDFPKLCKLRRSFDSRAVTVHRSSPQIIASCHEICGHLVHRPEHSLFARGDGVVSCGALCWTAIRQKGASFVLIDQLGQKSGRAQLFPRMTSGISMVSQTRRSSTALTSPSLDNRGRSVMRYVNQEHWEKVCSSGWYTFLGCEAKVISSVRDESCSWCSFPIGAHPPVVDLFGERLTKGQKAASSCPHSRGQALSTLWCEWRRPTSQVTRRQVVCPSTELEEAGKQPGCCVCAFRRCVRPLSLWIYRHPADSRPLVILWPTSMRLTDQAHRGDRSQLRGMNRRSLGCALLQLVCSKPAPDVCSGNAGLTSRKHVYPTLRVSNAGGYVWFFGIPDEAEVEVLFQTCCEHPNDCECNCRRLPLALLKNDRGLSCIRTKFNAVNTGSPTPIWEGSGAGPDEPVIAASIHKKCRKHGSRKEYIGRPQPLGVTAPTARNSAAGKSSSVHFGTSSDSQEAIHRPVVADVGPAALLRAESVWEEADLKAACAEGGPTGFVREVRSQLLGYSFKVAIERIVLALVSPFQVQDLEAPEYLSRRFGDIGIPEASRENPSEETVIPEHHSTSKSQGLCPRRARKEYAVSGREVEDVAYTGQLKRQFGTGGLVVTFAGASLSATPSLLFPRQDHLSFCLRSMVAENTHVQARSRRRVLVQALGRFFDGIIPLRWHVSLYQCMPTPRRYVVVCCLQSPQSLQDLAPSLASLVRIKSAISFDQALARAVARRRRYDELLISQSFVFEQDQSETEPASKSQRTSCDSEGGLAWKVEFGGLQLKILQCYTDICLCTMHLEKFCFSLTSNASVRLRLCRIGITGGGAGLPILLTESRPFGRSDLSRRKKQQPWSAAASRKRSSPLGSETVGSRFSITTESPQSWGNSVVTPWLDCCFHPTAACATAVKERFREEGYSIDDCSSLSLSVGDSSFIVRLPELVLLTHFFSDCRVAMVEFRVALSQRQKHQLVHTQHFWTQESTTVQPHDKSLLLREGFDSLESANSATHTMGMNALSTLQPLLLLHVRLSLPTLVFASVDSTSPPPVVVSCGELTVSTELSARARLPPASFDLRNVAKDIQGRLGRTGRRREPKRALSPACLFKIRFDKLRMFLISTPADLDRQRETQTTHEREDLPLPFPAASKRLSRVSSQESDEFETKLLWVPISDRASLTAELWKPLLARIPYQGFQPSPKLDTVSHETHSPSGLLPCEDISEAHPHGDAAARATSAEVPIHGLSGKVPTFASFDSCLDLRCSHVHLRITPQLVAAFHANSRINVYASPQLPLAPRSSCDAPSFHESRSRSLKDSETSSRAHGERAGAPGEAAGISGEARRSAVGRRLSSAKADGSFFAKFTGFMRGNQPFEPAVAASAASSERWGSKGSSLDNPLEALKRVDDESLPHVTPELKDSLSLVWGMERLHDVVMRRIFLGGITLSLCAAHSASELFTLRASNLCMWNIGPLVSIRKTSMTPSRSVTCEEQERTLGLGHPQHEENVPFIAENELMYIPPEICFCRFPLVLFPSMSQCVVGQGAVERLKTLTEKLEETYRRGKAASHSASEPSQDWAATLLSSLACQFGDSVTTSASLLPTAACLLIGNPAVLLQPRLVSVFHFFLASPIYSLAPLDSSQTDVVHCPVSQVPQPRSQFPYVTEDPLKESAAVPPTTPISVTSDGNDARQSNADRVATDHSCSKNSWEQRLTVPYGTPSLCHESDASVSKYPKSRTRRRLTLAGISVENGERGFAAASSQREGVSALPFHSRVAVGNQDKTTCNKVQASKSKPEPPRFSSRLSSMADKGHSSLSALAQSRGDSVTTDTGRDTGTTGRPSASVITASAVHTSDPHSVNAATYDAALFLHPSIAAVQQLQVLASWIAREFRTRLIQESEAAAAARVISRNKRMMRKQKRQIIRVGARRGMAKSAAAIGLSHAAGEHDTALGSMSHLKPCEGPRTFPSDAAGARNLLSILSLLGLVGLQSPFRGTVVHPPAEIVTSAAFMHVSVEAFTLELVAYPTAFVFEACIEASRHSQNLHFRVGSGRGMSTKPVSEPVVTGSESAASSSFSGKLVQLCISLQACCSDHISCVIPSYSVRVVRWDRAQRAIVNGDGSLWGGHATYSAREIETKQSAADGISGCDLSCSLMNGRAGADVPCSGQCCQFIVSSASASMDYQFLAPPLMFLTECVLAHQGTILRQHSPAASEAAKSLYPGAERVATHRSPALYPCLRGSNINDQTLSLFLMPLALKLTQGCLDDSVELQSSLSDKHEQSFLPWTALWSLDAEPVEWNPNVGSRGASGALHPMSPPYHDINVTVSSTRLLAGAVRGLPQSSTFAALCQPWVWFIPRMPLLHLRVAFPVFELILVNEPYDDQVTLVHAETSLTKASRPGCKISRSRSWRSSQAFLLPCSAPLLRLSVEDIRFAGANIMALSEAGSEGGMLLAESLRDNQDHGREDSKVKASAEQLHERIKLHLLGELRLGRGPNRTVAPSTPKLLACGGANIRLEFCVRASEGVDMQRSYKVKRRPAAAGSSHTLTSRRFPIKSTKNRPNFHVDAGKNINRVFLWEPLVDSFPVSLKLSAQSSELSVTLEACEIFELLPLSRLTSNLSLVKPSRREASSARGFSSNGVQIACASWHLHLLLLIMQQAAVEWRAGAIDSMNSLRAFWEHAMSQWLLPAVRILDPDSAGRVTDAVQFPRFMITPGSEGLSEVCSSPPTSKPLRGSNSRGTRMGRMLLQRLNSPLQQYVKKGSSCRTHSCVCVLESLPDFPDCFKNLSKPLCGPLRAMRLRDFQVFLLNASGMYLLLKHQASSSLLDSSWKLLRPNQTIGLSGCPSPGSQTWTAAEVACVEVLGVHPGWISMLGQRQATSASAAFDNFLAKLKGAEVYGAAFLLSAEDLPDTSLIELAVLSPGEHSNVGEAPSWKCQSFVVSVRAAVTADGLPHGNELITIHSPLTVRNLSPLGFTCSVRCKQVQPNFDRSHDTLPELDEGAINVRRDEGTSSRASRCCGYQTHHAEARSCNSPFVRLGENIWFSGLTDLPSNTGGCSSTDSDVTAYSFSCPAYNTVHGLPSHVLFNALKKRTEQSPHVAATRKRTAATAVRSSRRILEGSSWSFGLQANRLQCFRLLSSTMPSPRCLSCSSRCSSEVALCTDCSKHLRVLARGKQRRCSSATTTHVIGRKGTYCAAVAFQPGVFEGVRGNKLCSLPTSVFLIACFNTTSWAIAKKGLDASMEVDVFERQAKKAFADPSDRQGNCPDTDAGNEIAMQTWTLKVPVRICNHLPIPLSLRLVDLPLWNDMGSTCAFKDERRSSSGPPSEEASYHSGSLSRDDPMRSRKQGPTRCVPTGGWGLLLVPSESERLCCSVHGCDGLVGALELGGGPWSSWHILWTGFQNRELKKTPNSSEIRSKGGATGHTNHCVAVDLKYLPREPPYRRNLLSEETVIEVRDFCNRISEIRVCCIFSPVDPALPPFIRASAAAVTIIFTSPVTVLQRCVDTLLCISPGSAKAPLDFSYQESNLCRKNWCSSHDCLASSEDIHTERAKPDRGDYVDGAMWSHGQLSSRREAPYTLESQHHLEVVEANMALLWASQGLERKWPNLQTLSQLPQFFVSNKLVLGSQELTQLRLAEALSDAFSLRHEQSKQLVAAFIGAYGGQAESDFSSQRTYQAALAEDITLGCRTLESKTLALGSALPCLGSDCMPRNGQYFCGGTSCAPSWTPQYDSFAGQESGGKPDKPIVAEWSLDLDLEKLLCPALWDLLPRCVLKAAGVRSTTHQFLPKELEIKGLRRPMNLKIGDKDFVLHQTKMRRPDSHFLLLTILPFLPSRKTSRPLGSLPARVIPDGASQGKPNMSNMRELQIISPVQCSCPGEASFFTFSELFEPFDEALSDGHAKPSAEHLGSSTRKYATAVSKVLSTAPQPDEWAQLCSFLSAPSVTLQVLPRFVFINTTKLGLELRQVFPSSRREPVVVSAYNMAFGGAKNGRSTYGWRHADSFQMGNSCKMDDAKLREHHVMDGATPIFRLPHNCAIVFHFADVEAAYAVNIRIASTPDSIRPTLDKRAPDSFDPLELPHPSFEGLRLYDVLLHHGVFRQKYLRDKMPDSGKAVGGFSTKMDGNLRKPVHASTQVSGGQQSSISSSSPAAVFGVDAGKSAIKASGSHEAAEDIGVSDTQDYSWRRTVEALRDSRRTSPSESWLPRDNEEGREVYQRLRRLSTEPKAKRKQETGMSPSWDSVVGAPQGRPSGHYEYSTRLKGEHDRSALTADEADYRRCVQQDSGFSGVESSSGEFLTEVGACVPPRKRRFLQFSWSRRPARRRRLEMLPRMRRTADLCDASCMPGELGRASVLAESLRTQPTVLNKDVRRKLSQGTPRLSASSATEWTGGRADLVDMGERPCRDPHFPEAHGLWGEPRQAFKFHSMGRHVETQTKYTPEPTFSSRDFASVSDAELTNGEPKKPFEDVQLPYFLWTDALCIGAPPSASEAIIDRRTTQSAGPDGAEPRASADISGKPSTAGQDHIPLAFEDAGEAAASRSASQSIPLYDCIGNLFAAIRCTKTTGKGAHDSGVSYIHLLPAQVAPIHIENHLTETPILVTASAPRCFSNVDSFIAAPAAAELIPTLIDGPISGPPPATSSSGPPANVVPPLQARPMWLRRALPLCLACEVGDKAATIAQSAQDSALSDELHRIRQENFRMLRRFTLGETHQQIDEREVKQSTMSPSQSHGESSDSVGSGESPHVSPRLKDTRSSQSATPRAKVSDVGPRLPPFKDYARDFDESSVSDFLWPPSGLRKILGLVQGATADRLRALWHVARAAAEAARLRWPLPSEAHGMRQGSWGLEGVRHWYNCVDNALLSGIPPPHSSACPRGSASFTSRAKYETLQRSGPAAMAASAAATLEHGEVDVGLLQEKLYFHLVGEDLAWIEFGLDSRKCLRVELQHPRRSFYFSARTRGSTFIVSITRMPPRRVRMAEAASKVSSSSWETGIVSAIDQQPEQLHKENRQRDKCLGEDCNVQNKEDEGIAQRQLTTRRRAPPGSARSEISDKTLSGKLS